MHVCAKSVKKRKERWISNKGACNGCSWIFDFDCVVSHVFLIVVSKKVMNTFYSMNRVS